MAKIRQFWMVVPLDIKEDQNHPHTVAQNVEQDFAEPARRGTLRPVPVGYGFKIASAETKRFNMAFTTKQLADDHAKAQAEQNPKVLFGVFGCEGTYETTTPTVIQKTFNEDGELTPTQA